MKQTIGKATITNIYEQDLHDLAMLIPAATPENLAKIDWLKPHFVDANNIPQGIVQAIVVELDGNILVVDTCIGDEKDIQFSEGLSNAKTGFLDRFKNAGLDPEKVDFVLCTHLHFDHVGWNTYNDNGEWKPTFPNARYLYNKVEMGFWLAANKELEDSQTLMGQELPEEAVGFFVAHIKIHEQSIEPIRNAGLMELVDIPHEPIPGITLIPSPGHTPGHICIQVESGGEKAIITGDSFHHPCQIVHPEWATIADIDQDASTATRKNFLANWVEDGTVMVGTHFCEPVCGKLAKDGDSYKLDFTS